MIMTTVSRYSGNKHFTSSVKRARTKKAKIYTVRRIDFNKRICTILISIQKSWRLSVTG